MKKDNENPGPSFRIRLEARLKNDMLISAREKLKFTQQIVADAIGITHIEYGKIERMQHYPSKGLKRQIVAFYRTYGIRLNQKAVFPIQLRKARFRRKYTAIKEIPAYSLLSFSSLDTKLLAPVEINDMNIREDDLKIAIDDALNYLPRLKGKPPMSDVLRMYFGLSPYEKEYTEEEIAQKYNTFKQEISQIKKKAMKELMNNQRTKDLKQFLG